MRQASLLTWVSILALFVGGCQSGGDGEPTGGNTPSPSPIASPIQPKPSPSAAPFGSKPLVAQQPGSTTTVPGLIPPVPPDDVIKRINKGRVDPFTAVPVQPEVTVSPNPSAPGTPSARPVPQIPQLPPIRQPNGGASRAQAPRTRTQAPGTRTQAPRTRTQAPGTRTQAPRTNPRGQASKAVPPRRVQTAPRSLPKPGATQVPRPNGTNNIPKPIPGGSLPGGPVATAPQLIPELPKLPEPTQARGIEVSGVVQVGGTPVAIVKVPNEPARYVREGQRIANGQVLVKRIEMNRGPDPVVILEQYGVEVARGVGEAPATAPGQPGQGPTASLPPAPPS